MLVGSSRGWRGPRFLIAIISDASILEQSEVVVIPHGRSRSAGGESAKSPTMLSYLASSRRAVVRLNKFVK